MCVTELMGGWMCVSLSLPGGGGRCVCHCASGGRGMCVSLS